MKSADPATRQADGATLGRHSVTAAQKAGVPAMMPSMTTTPSSLADRRWLILLSSVFSFFAIGATFFVVPPLVPELVSRFGLSHFKVGLLMGSISVPAVFLAIVVGLAVDRWEPRRIGVISLGLMFVGAVTFATAPTFGILLAGRLLFGVGGLVVNLMLARLLTAAFAGRELALAMGVFMATYPASMITVYSLHPVLIERIGWRNELLLLAALVGLAIPLFLVAVGRVKSEDAPVERRRVSVRVSPSLAALAATWLLFFAVHSTVLTFAPEWAGGGAKALLIVTIVMWVAMIGSPLAGTLIDRTSSPTRWVVGGLMIQSATLAGTASGLLSPSPAMFGIGLAATLVPTAVYALPGLLVEPERVGFAFGFITSFSNLGTIFGPAAVGVLLDRTGSWSLVWTVLAGVALVAAVVSTAVRVR
jgi:predicted MFS family arabinose efflux permease